MLRVQHTVCVLAPATKSGVTDTDSFTGWLASDFAFALALTAAAFGAGAVELELGEDGLLLR